MSMSCPRLRTASRLVVLASIPALAWSAGSPRHAGAAVICQHPKKQAVRLRADVCKAKEQTVFATGSVGELSGQIAGVGTQVGELRTVVGLECPGDPQRRLLTATRDIGGFLVLLGYTQFSLCRTLDDDPTACGQRRSRWRGTARAHACPCGGSAWGATRSSRPAACAGTSASRRWRARRTRRARPRWVAARS